MTEALNFLVEQPDYHDLKQEAIILANTRHGRFSGDHYPLNALVEYAREKGGAEWLEPLWTVADKAVTPQEPKETQEPPEPKAPEARFDRKAYQAAYMRAFRDRERKACALMYKLMTPQERKALPRGLVGAPRPSFWSASVRSGNNARPTYWSAWPIPPNVTNSARSSTPSWTIN